jgi:hypothetical protein
MELVTMSPYQGWRGSVLGTGTLDPPHAVHVHLSRNGSNPLTVLRIIPYERAYSNPRMILKVRSCFQQT